VLLAKSRLHAESEVVVTVTTEVGFQLGLPRFWTFFMPTATRPFMRAQQQWKRRQHYQSGK
jgi:hypothetical protein